MDNDPACGTAPRSWSWRSSVPSWSRSSGVIPAGSDGSWWTPSSEIVGEAADGAQAEPLIRRTRPDVVLLDIRMPVQDGLVTTERLRGRDGTGRHHPDHFRRRRAGAAGAGRGGGRLPAQGHATGPADRGDPRGRGGDRPGPVARGDRHRPVHERRDGESQRHPHRRRRPAAPTGSPWRWRSATRVCSDRDGPAPETPVRARRPAGRQLRLMVNVLVVFSMSR